MDDADEEELFRQFMTQCVPCKPVQTDIDEEEEFRKCNLRLQSSNYTSSSSSSVLAPILSTKQHAYGNYREASSTSTGFSCTTSMESDDARSIEDEGHCQNKIALVSGKPERHDTKGRKELVRIKKEQALMSTEIASALVPCRRKSCNLRFTYHDVEEARIHFWSLTRAEQQDWLTRELAFWGTPDTIEGVFKFKYMVGEKHCCAVFYENALMVSHGRLVDVRKRVLSKNFEDCFRMPSAPNTPMADRIEQFIASYAEEQSGAMPTKDKKVELPSGTTKDKVYIEYLLTFDEGDTSSASLSTWYRVWSQQWPTIKANNRANRFSKCSKCSNIKVLREFTSGMSKGTNSC